MQLELLVPTTQTQASKDALRAWYSRRGYERTTTRPFALDHPEIAQDAQHPSGGRARQPAPAGEIAHTDRSVAGHDLLQETERPVHRPDGP